MTLLFREGMENARQRISQITVDIMRASRVQPGGGMQQPYGQQVWIMSVYLVLIWFLTVTSIQYRYLICISCVSIQAAAPVAIPSCLLLLPLYSMSLQKSAVVRGGNDTRVDERAYFQQLLFNMDIEEVRVGRILIFLLRISWL